MKKLPHTNSYVRLGVSKIHGIGVFAVRDIPKGTSIFSDDMSKMVWIDGKDIRGIAPRLKKLYDDFCVMKDGRYGCPENFNNLTVSWYINESKKRPNIRCDNSYDFFALRRIRAREELMVDYSTYSEEPGYCQ